MKFYRDLFEASLNRVVPEHDKQRFFQAFYSTFIHMSPETEQHFSQRSGEEGQQMIFKSFFAMLAVCDSKSATDPLPASAGPIIGEVISAYEP